MKIIKKVLLATISFAIILTLFSCSVNTKIKETVAYESKATRQMNGTTGLGFTRAAKVADYGVNSVALAEMAVEDAADLSNSSSSQKIIKTVDINAETKNFDESLEWVRNHVKQYNGTIDNSYVDLGNMTYTDFRKNAHFTVRVPAEKLDDFLNTIGDNLNVTFRNENTQDVTEEYDDTESRIRTLKIEEENLNELMKKAKTVEDMVKIEEKLSSVRLELQNISRRLARLDNKIVYSTVSINITEVKDLTEYIEEDDYSKETISKQIQKNFEATKAYLIKQGINILVHLPQIVAVLIGILIILILILIFSAIFGKKENKKQVDYNKNKVKIENTITDNSNVIGEREDNTFEKVVSKKEDIVPEKEDRVSEKEDRVSEKEDRVSEKESEVVEKKDTTDSIEGTPTEKTASLIEEEKAEKFSDTEAEKND